MSLSKEESSRLQKIFAEVHRLKEDETGGDQLRDSVMREVARLSLPQTRIERPAPAGWTWRKPVAAVGFALVVICVAAALYMSRGPEKQDAEVCLKTSQDVVAAQLFFVD